MSFIKEVIDYFRHDRQRFKTLADAREREADAAYQGSMTSAMEVTREAKKAMTNADFIRRVLDGN